ncbi:MAG: DUF4282 domain-containing protein [Pseudonocardia sp.]|nr:DUF4282 domain-containing protein [Pseudonocardia sp.]
MSYDPASGGPQQPQGWQGGQPPYPPPGGGYGQQPPAGWGPPPPPGGGGFGGPTGTPEQKNPLSALFDFSFTSFATPGLIKLLYVVGAALLVIAWLGYTVFGFAQGAALGILFLILGAVVVLFYLAFLRLILEFYFAVVRMSEDIHNRR